MSAPQPKGIFRELGGSLEFVGDFDGLYRSEADPWGQSGARGPMASYYAASRNRLASALAGHLRGNGERLEVGCGHGHVLAQINNAVRGGRWHGLDVSLEAIEQARSHYPAFEFHVGDIASPFTPPTLGLGRFDAVILSQVLWYVLEAIDDTVCHCKAILRPGGILVVSQAFLRGPQRYGADIADGFHGALRLFCERFPELRLIEAQFDDSHTHQHHDGLLVFRRP